MGKHIYVYARGSGPSQVAQGGCPGANIKGSK